MIQTDREGVTISFCQRWHNGKDMPKAIAKSDFARIGAPCHNRTFEHGMKLLQDRAKYLEAAKKAGIFVSGLWSRMTSRLDQCHERIKARMGLYWSEESLMVDVLKGCTAMGLRLTREDLTDTIKMIARQMIAARQAKIPFCHGRPGRDFCTGFEHFNAHETTLRRHIKPNALQYAGNNAELLVRHIHGVESLLKTYDFRPTHIVNVDEICFLSEGEDRCNPRSVHTPQ